MVRLAIPIVTHTINKLQVLVLTVLVYVTSTNNKAIKVLAKINTILCFLHE